MKLWVFIQIKKLESFYFRGRLCSCGAESQLEDYKYRVVLLRVGYALILSVLDVMSLFFTVVMRLVVCA